MRVDFYSLCWNERHQLEFFMRHYESWVERFVIYDDGSTDGSREFLEDHPKVELRRRFWTNADSHVESERAFANEAWKESRNRADWVIIGEIDEHLYHPCMLDYLRECRDQRVTVVPALGYQMISRTLPPRGITLCQTLTHGAPWSMMSKLTIIDPNAVDAMNYAPGRHKATPTGNVRWPAADEVLNLHYKYLGFEETYARHQFLFTGLRERDLANGWAHKYSWSKDEFTADWEAFERRIVDIANPEQLARSKYSEKPWWNSLRDEHESLLNVAGHLKTPGNPIFELVPRDVGTDCRTT